MPETSVAAIKETSRSMRKIQEDMVALRQELEASGRLKAATVINFNPVPLVQDGLISMTVPAAGTDEISKVELEYGGQVYAGHAVVVRTPKLYARTDGVTTDPEGLGDYPSLAAAAILPIGIVHSFWEHYSGNLLVSPHMGGVLIFEGDRHALDPRHLERNQGMIAVPEVVRLPRNRRTYNVVMRPLEEVVATLFLQQAQYAVSVFDNANGLWDTNDPMQQKQITDIDRRWARYALDHGLIEVLPEWSHKAALSGKNMLSVVRCPVCLKPQPAPNVYLCPNGNCRAPYNACEAFLAGMPVPQQYLDALEGEELQMVARELALREQRMKKALADARSYVKQQEAE